MKKISSILAMNNTTISLIMDQFNYTNSFPKEREEVSDLAYNNFVQQIKTSKTFKPKMKNKKNLTDIHNVLQKQNNNEIIDNSLNTHNGKSSLRISINRSKSQGKTNGNIYTKPQKEVKKTINDIIKEYAPIIAKDFSFLRTDLINNDIFIENKYAQLFE